MDDNTATTIALVTLMTCTFGTAAYLIKCNRDVNIEKIKFMSNMCQKAGVKITQNGEEKNVTITLNEDDKNTDDKNTDNKNDDDKNE